MILELHHQCLDVTAAHLARAGGKNLELRHAMKMRQRFFMCGHLGHHRLRTRCRLARVARSEKFRAPVLDSRAGRRNHAAPGQCLCSIRCVDHDPSS